MARKWLVKVGTLEICSVLKHFDSHQSVLDKRLVCVRLHIEEKDDEKTILLLFYFVRNQNKQNNTVFRRARPKCTYKSK